MSNTMGVTEKSIYLNTTDYGSDVYIVGSEPVNAWSSKRIAKVAFFLSDSRNLCKIADASRIKLGFLPMFPEDESAEYDDDGWYNFVVEVKDYPNPACKVAPTIDFTVVSEYAEDNEDLYHISLTPEERELVWEELNEECIKELGMTCEDILQEARLEMIRYEEWKRKWAVKENEGSAE